MRVLVGLGVAMAFIVASLPADAKPQRRAAKHQRHKTQKSKHKAAKKRAARISTMRERDRVDERSESGGRGPAGSAGGEGGRPLSINIRELMRGQSIGAPQDGRLQHATQLLPGDTYHIRRPYRAFGTSTTVEFVERAIAETFEAYPDQHVLAIGDISAESGGPITEHHSHQSGRDADIGLFYKEQPAGYPRWFIPADEDNLDCAATFKLIERFLATTNEDGGAQVIFLDFDVQGLIYDWAIDSGISERRLGRIFQYPHGRGAPEGLVRHEPNHDNHLHVRFRCPSDDTSCR
jgi:hypothetical protein